MKDPSTRLSLLAPTCYNYWTTLYSVQLSISVSLAQVKPSVLLGPATHPYRYIYYKGNNLPCHSHTSRTSPENPAKILSLRSSVNCRWCLRDSSYYLRYNTNSHLYLYHFSKDLFHTRSCWSLPLRTVNKCSRSGLPLHNSISYLTRSLFL